MNEVVSLRYELNGSLLYLNLYRPDPPQPGGISTSIFAANALDVGIIMVGKRGSFGGDGQ
jgi:hypothetical protein